MGSIIDDFDFIDNNNIETCKFINSNVLTKIKNKFKRTLCWYIIWKFMKTFDGKIKVIEFNCRFGDSEGF